MSSSKIHLFYFVQEVSSFVFLLDATQNENKTWNLL